MIVSYIADIYDRKTVLLISTFLCHMTAFVVPFSTTYYPVLCWRGLSGAQVISSLPIYLSILGDSFPPSRRSTASVISSIVVGFGMLAGQTLSGFLSARFGWRFFFKLVLLLGLMLFCIGILFAYKVTLPFMLNFLVTLEGTDYITASISIESYINLCLTMFIIFGCVFEMPLVTIILAKMGIANPEIMKKGRGVAIVLIFLVAAIITPPDIVSQCFVAVPMCLLYFVSIFLSGIFYKPRPDDDEDDEEEDEPDEE